MKEFVIGFVLIVAGILLTPLLTPYFSKVDCDYILSEQIPTKFLDKDSLKESLQQIKIRNNEDKSLNNIKIIIKKKIIDFDIKKVSLTDSIKVKKIENEFDLEYSSILAKSQVILVLKFQSYETLKDSDIKIIHSSGIINSIDVNKSFPDKYAGILFIATYFISMAIWLIRSLQIDYGQKNPIQYLNSKKMLFFISKSNLTNKIKEYIFVYFSSKDKNGLKILNADLTVLENDDKSWLIVEATKIYIESLDREYFIFGKAKLLKFWDWLKINKPLNISEADWSSYRIDKIKKDFLTVEYALEILNNNLEFVSNDEKKILYGIATDNILQSVYDREITIQKPQNIREKDWKKIEEIKEKHRLSRVYQFITFNWFYILDNEELQNKPDYVTDKEWEIMEKTHSVILKNKKAMEDFETEMIDKEIELYSEKSELTEQKQEITTIKNDIEMLKRKLTNQMKIINDIFENPNSINYIEEYNNTFSSGNFDSLKKLANFLKENRKSY